jgi:hypothetical protein
MDSAQPMSMSMSMSMSDSWETGCARIYGPSQQSGDVARLYVIFQHWES